MKSSITVLLPAYNEEKAIGKVIHDINALSRNYNILVVDNACTNGTAKKVAALGVEVLYEAEKGKGNAIRAGFKHIKTPLVVMIDADGTYPVDAIPVCCDALLEYDVVKGARQEKEDGSMSKVHKFGNWGLSILASVLYGYRVKDVCSGLWAFRMVSLNKFKLTSAGFTLEADIFINTVKNKCKLKEITIPYSKRVDGDEAKLRFIDGFKIAWFLIRKRWSK